MTGAVGGFPKTGMVFDYSLFERVFYNLVVGYNVFSNISAQTGARMYTDLERREGELAFLLFLPSNIRSKIWGKWYPQLSSLFVKEDSKMLAKEMPTGINFTKKYKKPVEYKNNFFKQIIDKRLRKDIGYHYDPINFHSDQLDRRPALKITSEEDLDKEFKKITHIKGGFVKSIANRMDVAFVRFLRNGSDDLVYTIILNRYHKNVRFILGEDSQLDISKNTINVVKGFLGCYPNAFLEVKLEDATTFFKMFRAINNTPDSFYMFFKRFGIKRSNPNFWKVSDFFNKRFKDTHPLSAGFFDLNSYINDPQPPTTWDRILFHFR